MHPDLKEVIEKAKEAREALIAKDISVKEANSIYNHNHSIVTVHALDLRERIFLAETANQLAGGEQPEQLEHEAA